MLLLSWTIAAGTRAAQPIINSDSLIYHIQSVLWIKQSAVIPGLANLHPAYGFTNSSFLISALLDFGFWEGRAYTALNSYLIFLAPIHFLYIIVRRQGLRAAQISAYVFIFILFLLLLNNTNHANSLSTDIPIYIISFLVAIILLSSIRQDDTYENSIDKRDHHHFVALFLTTTSAAAVAIKVTAFSLFLISGLYLLITQKRIV